MSTSAAGATSSASATHRGSSASVSRRPIRRSGSSRHSRRTLPAATTASRPGSHSVSTLRSGSRPTPAERTVGLARERGPTIWAAGPGDPSSAGAFPALCTRTARPEATRPRPVRAGTRADERQEEFAPLRALLATALEEGLIRTNPAAGIRVASPVPHTLAEDQDERPKALTEDELVLVLAALDHDRRPFFEFLYETGLPDLGGDRGQAPRRRRHLASRRSPLLPGHGWAPERSQAAARASLAANGAASLDHAPRRRVGQPPIRVGERRPDRPIERDEPRPQAGRSGAGLGCWIKTERGRRADTWIGFHTFRHTRATALFRDGWNAVQVSSSATPTRASRSGLRASAPRGPARTQFGGSQGGHTIARKRRGRGSNRSGRSGGVRVITDAPDPADVWSGSGALPSIGDAVR